MRLGLGLDSRRDRREDGRRAFRSGGRKEGVFSFDHIFAACHKDANIFDGRKLEQSKETLIRVLLEH